MPSFFVENFGCRAARADGEAVSDRLRSAGLAEEKASLADVVVVNTCSVTAEADRAARAFIRRAHRQNPAARIVVTGCYAQRAPEELASLAGVSAVVGNSHKALAPEIVLGLVRRAAPLAVAGHSAAHSELLPVGSLLAGERQHGLTTGLRTRFLRRRSLRRARRPVPTSRFRRVAGTLHLLRDSADTRLVAESFRGKGHETGGRICGGRGKELVLPGSTWALGRILSKAAASG